MRLSLSLCMCVCVVATRYIWPAANRSNKKNKINNSNSSLHAHRKRRWNNNFLRLSPHAHTIWDSHDRTLLLQSLIFFFNRTIHNEEFFSLATFFPFFWNVKSSGFFHSFHNRNIYWFIALIGSVYFLSPFLRQFCSDLWFFCSYRCCCRRYRLCSIFLTSQYLQHFTFPRVTVIIAIRITWPFVT